jgi:hypothetical protein
MNQVFHKMFAFNGASRTRRQKLLTAQGGRGTLDR